jgi:hypothetical protein
MLLPITSANSMPVMCIIIFQVKELDVPAALKSGIDIRVSPVVRDNDEIIATDQSNFGEVKIFPDATVCTYLGKVISCVA